MQEIEGIVMSARVRNHTGRFSSDYLYGPNYGSQSLPEMCGIRPYTRFSTNGLVPFEDINTASLYKLDLYKQLLAAGEYVTQVGCANIYFQIAEHPGEWGDLDPKLPYILIAESAFMHQLYGKKKERAISIGYLPVSELEDNGFCGWRDLEETKYAREEVARQGGMSAKVATIDYRRVPIGTLSGLRIPVRNNCVR